jgi:plasmid stabilization system protein ParE
MVHVTFAESAVEDLKDIRAWYAEQHVPDVGARLVAEVVSQIERLADFPESGRVVPEFGTPKLRELIHAPFRIVYRHDPGHVRIVRVWRSERLMQEME